MRWAIPSLALALAFSGGCRTSEPPARLPLTTIAPVRSLRPDQLRHGYPVHFTGVVLYWEPRTRLLIMGDGKDAILVDQLDPSQELAKGTTADVDGFTGYDNFSPIVVKARVTPKPATVPISSRPISPEELLAGHDEHQLVTLKCRFDSFTSLMFDKMRAYFRVGDSNVSGVVLRDTTGVLDERVGKDVTVTAIPTVRRTPTGAIQAVDLLIYSGFDISATPSPPSFLLGPDWDLRELTSVHAIKALTATEARKRYPVKVRGVTLLCAMDHQLMMIHDGREGLYVFPLPSVVHGIAAGDIVEVAGYTDPGGFSPIVFPTKVTKVGTAPMPRAVPVTPDTILSPALDNEWVEIQGIVRSVHQNAWSYPLLHVSIGRQLFDLEVLDHNANVANTIDSKVNIHGIWSPLYDRGRQLRGFRVFAPSAEYIVQKEHLPPKPGIEDIATLRSYAIEDVDPRRIHVEGVVTASRRDGRLWVQDPTGGIEIDQSAVPTSVIQPGSFIRATGLVPVGIIRSALEEATIDPIPQRRAVQPAHARVEDCADGDMDARLVRLQAYITDIGQELGDTVVQARSGRNEFSARLEPASDLALPDSVRPGSLVELTGVCKTSWNIERQPPQPEEMTLMLRSPADIRILETASWWTKEHTLAVLAGMTALSLLIAGWLILLRRRVAAQAKILREQMTREAELHSQLEQARRLESIGRLAGGIAHDFNNLLTVILGYADDIARELPADSAMKEEVDQILKAGSNAASLTRQLLAYSRRQALQPRVLSLNDELRESLPILRRVLDESVDLRLHLAERLPCIKVDQGQLHQVLINLVANARDAMPHGGRLTIETSTTEVDADDTTSTQIMPGKYVRLTLTDTGQGMDEDTKSHLFEPFYTTKGFGKGTGLGLATVYGIIKQSGGHIWVYSEPGMGSAFKILFPATTETPTVVKQHAAAHARVQGKILLVEDRDDVRRLTANILADSGFTVVEAASGERALELAEANGEVDLLIVDAVLPGITGRQVAEALTQRFSRLRVLYMSGYTENVVMSRGQVKPGIRLLEKPFTREQLLTHVEEALSSTPR